MTQTYKPGQTTIVRMVFLNEQQYPLVMDTDSVVLNLGVENEGRFLKDVPMVYNVATNIGSYESTIKIPADTAFGTYSLRATGTLNGVPYEQFSELVVGGSYITVAELKAKSVGFDFSKYYDDELLELGMMAKDIIDSYVDSERGVGLVTQKGQTVVDNLGRIYFRFNRKPVLSVSYLRVRVPASTSIVLYPKYLDLFAEQGYAYYPVSTAYGASAVGTYPLIVLGYMDKVLYQITYRVDDFIPPMIKRASAIICANFLKSDYYKKQLGITGMNGPISTFKSGEYLVGIDTKRMYKGKGTPGGTLLSPDVQEILDRYKSMKNNSF